MPTFSLRARDGKAGGVGQTGIQNLTSVYAGMAVSMLSDRYNWQNVDTSLRGYVPVPGDTAPPPDEGRGLGVGRAR